MLRVQIRNFSTADVARVLELWRRTPGLVLREVDAPHALAGYLARNPGLSFVALDDSAVVGAVLCGTDGRRGYLQHLAVAASHRNHGIGRQLAEHAVAALAHLGVDKCHLMVLAENEVAQSFWRHLGWKDRNDVRLMSHTHSGMANA